MGQRNTKVRPMTFEEVYNQHLSTPPNPSTNTEVQHPHPRDETPVGAGGGEEGGGGEKEGGEGEEGGGEKQGEEGGGGGEEEGEEGGGGGEEEEGEEEEEKERKKEEEEERTEEANKRKEEEEEERKEEEEERKEEEAVKERKEAEGVKEKRKSKKWWRRLCSFFRDLAPHSSAQREEEQKRDEGEKRKVAWAGRSSDDYIFSRYTIGDELGKGGFGVVYEGRRLDDDLKVALKYVTKTQHMECISILDHPNPLPKEIALTILANKGPRVPEIIRLLDWTDHPDHFVMVLECPSPCEDLVEFTRRHGGSISEETTRQIMRQVANAVNTCHLRGVLHRDVKLENLLINRETSEVKLIDFGCGDILRRSPYESYSGTPAYSPPEYRRRGKYYGGPATVWSLGILMFRLLCGHLPSDYDLFLLQGKRLSKPGLSKECRDLLRALLHKKQSWRLDLGQILSHNWFKVVS